jgi:hypothetical protein
VLLLLEGGVAVFEPVVELPELEPVLLVSVFEPVLLLPVSEPVALFPEPPAPAAAGLVNPGVRVGAAGGVVVVPEGGLLA